MVKTALLAVPRAWPLRLLQGAPRGSRRLETLRREARGERREAKGERRGARGETPWAPSHCFGCSSQPLQRLSVLLPLTTQEEGDEDGNAELDFEERRSETASHTDACTPRAGGI